MQSELFIKNMVCDRCKRSVEHIFKKLNLPRNEVRLGEVSLPRELTPQETQSLAQALI